VVESKVPALATLLREAGFTWASADEVTAALDRLGREGCSSDDVCSALFRWRTKCINRALGEARKRARDVIRGHGLDSDLSGSVPVTDDEGDTGVEQLRLWCDAGSNPATFPGG
jgi:hypothetical protein